MPFFQAADARVPATGDAGNVAHAPVIVCKLISCAGDDPASALPFGSCDCTRNSTCAWPIGRPEPATMRPGASPFATQPLSADQRQTRSGAPFVVELTTA